MLLAVLTRKQQETDLALATELPEARQRLRGFYDFQHFYNTNSIRELNLNKVHLESPCFLYAINVLNLAKSAPPQMQTCKQSWIINLNLRSKKMGA